MLSSSAHHHQRASKKEGTLWKWTNYISGWQPRWFVLEVGVLSYYLSQAEVGQGCRGSLKITSCDITVHPTDRHRIDVVIPGEVHMYLRAGTTPERQQWLVALGSSKQEESSILLEDSELMRRQRADALRSKMADLHLHCRLLLTQVAAIKSAVAFPEQPNVETMVGMSNSVSSTCDTFLNLVTECSDLVSDDRATWPTDLKLLPLVKDSHSTRNSPSPVPGGHISFTVPSLKASSSTSSHHHHHHSGHSGSSASAPTTPSPLNNGTYQPHPLASVGGSPTHSSRATTQQQQTHKHHRAHALPATTTTTTTTGRTGNTRNTGNARNVGNAGNAGTERDLHSPIGDAHTRAHAHGHVANLPTHILRRNSGGSGSSVEKEKQLGTTRERIRLSSDSDSSSLRPRKQPTHTSSHPNQQRQQQQPIMSLNNRDSATRVPPTIGGSGISETSGALKPPDQRAVHVDPIHVAAARPSSNDAATTMLPEDSIDGSVGGTATAAHRRSSHLEGGRRSQSLNVSAVSTEGSDVSLSSSVVSENRVPSRSYSDLFLTPTSSPASSPPPSPPHPHHHDDDGGSSGNSGLPCRIADRVSVTKERESSCQTFFSKLPHKFGDLVLSREDGVPTAPFLECCTEVLPFFDKLSPTAFSPVKADINGNINKLMRRYNRAPHSYPTLQSMVLEEVQANSQDSANSATDALLWLKRAMEFVQVFLGEVSNGEKSLDVAAGKAYTKSLRRHHNWIVKGIFSLAMRAVPYYEDFLVLLGSDGTPSGNGTLVLDMREFADCLGQVVLVINQFYHRHGLLDAASIATTTMALGSS